MIRDLNRGTYDHKKLISQQGRKIHLCYDVYRFCHFELQKISDVDPAITFVNEFDRFRHFELEQISDVDPAITF